MLERSGLGRIFWLAGTCLATAIAVVGWFATARRSPDSWQSKIATANMTRAAATYAATRSLPGETEPVSCAVCHGVQGQGNYGLENPKHVAPHLAGLNAVYVGEQLSAYASGTRVFPFMHEMALPLSLQDIADLAVYVHGLRGRGAVGLPPADAAELVRGRAIWVDGIPGHAAACASCHGRQAAGAVMRSPEIAGEPQPYLVAQLHTMRDSGRTGTVAAHVMSEQAHELDNSEIVAVASYVASLPPASTLRDQPVR